MSQTIHVTGTLVLSEPVLDQKSINFVTLAPSAAQEDLGTYAGKFAFLERVRDPDATPQSYSSYHNGEYFVVRNTRGAIYATTLSVGYGGHEVKTFNLLGSVGTERYKVLDSYQDDAAVRRFIEDQEKWLVVSDVPGKRQWTESVYSGARSVLRQVERAMRQ